LRDERSGHSLKHQNLSSRILYLPAFSADGCDCNHVSCVFLQVLDFKNKSKTARAQFWPTLLKDAAGIMQERCHRFIIAYDPNIFIAPHHCCCIPYCICDAGASRMPVRIQSRYPAKAPTSPAGTTAQ